MIQRARGHRCAHFRSISLTGRKSSFHPMACSTANAINIVYRLDHDGKLDKDSQNQKQMVATGLLCDKLHTQDFSWTNLFTGLQSSGINQVLSS